MATPILPLIAAKGPRLESTYLARVIKREGCWGWSGSKYPGGYPKMPFNHSSHMLAHRYSFASYYGIEPGDMLVCHRCDNRECTNPEHLFLGSHQDNSNDKIAKGRARYVGQPGGENPNAVLSGEDVACIRRATLAGMANTEISRLFGVTHSQISTIRLSKTWKHIDAGEVVISHVKRRVIVKPK